MTYKNRIKELAPRLGMARAMARADMEARECPGSNFTHRQGKRDCACSLKASQDAMKSPAIIGSALVLAVAALIFIVAKLFGIDLDIPT